MSDKSSAVSAFCSAAKAAAGAFLTVEARLATARRFVAVLYDEGFRVRDVRTIGTRHFVAYVKVRACKVGVRTLQNEAAHLRGLLRAARRTDLANHPSISNEALGIAGSCRSGTNAAATEVEYQSAVQVMTARDPGLGVIVQLERLLGLRSQEAIRAGASLATWERQLIAGEPVHVIFGTKGGRARHTDPVDPVAALAAVRLGLGVVRARGGHLLIGSLKAASTSYRNEMHRHCAIAGHQLRYAYAQQLKAQLDARQYSSLEALALTSVSLGHGDGRGRYVRQVYCQDVPTFSEADPAEAPVKTREH